MREAQKVYSRTHNAVAFGRCEKLEKEVDRLIDEYFNSKQTSLF